MLTILFISFLVLVFINTPVAFAMGIASLLAVWLTGDLPLNMLVTRMFVAVDSFPLMAVPFFILAGEIMNAGGITKRIVNFSRALVGFIKGGLAHVNIVASMIFAGISGSATADSSAMGSMLIPIMVEDDYSPEFSVVVTATSSTIGPVIPPSMMMVIYGVIANVSIASLFLGGIIPGVAVGLALMAMSYHISARKGYGTVCAFSWKLLGETFKKATLALMMPIIILGGIVSGIFTATEAGVIATVYAIVVGLFVYKTIKLKNLPKLFIKSAVTTTICLFVIATASIFGWLLAWEGFPEMVRDLLLSISNNPDIVLILIIAFIFLLGLFVEGIPVLIIFAPIFVPVMAHFGVNLVHFGVVFVMAVLIGSVTPPVGILLYLCCGIAKIPVSQASKIIWPFVLMLVLVLYLCVLFPALVTFIPKTLGY